MKKLFLTLTGLATIFIGFAQSPCSQLNASMNFSQTGASVTITNTSTLPTGGTNVYSSAVIYYGDGNVGFPNPSDTYTYPYSGTYNLSMVQYWVDSTNSNSTSCTDTVYQTVVITTAPPPPPPPCAFTVSAANNGSGSYTFTASNSSLTYTWKFGDGSTSSGNPVTHTYANTGYYVVLATGSGAGCSNNSDSVSVAYNPPQVNEISGVVTYDSSVTSSALSFKVWLIEEGYNSSIGSVTLTAVDSLITPAQSYWANYSFMNKPAGNYYVKARVAPGTTNPGLVPTYHQSSATWTGATKIIHTGGYNHSNMIYMIAGAPTSGPGFIGGNVSQGAGKGTNTGIASQLVLLRDGSNNVVASTYTDGNGDYSFGNLDNGSYTIYPEEMNYQTTPSAALVIGAGTNTYNYVDFEKNSTTIKPKTTAVKDIVNNIFSIYPNPTKGQINISWKDGIKGEAQIAVTDIAGRMVYQTQANTSTGAQIQLGNLNEGVYFIKITTAKGQYTERILFQ